MLFYSLEISNDMEKSCATSIAEFFSNANVALQLFLRFACCRGPEHGVLGMLYYLSGCIFYQSNKIVMHWMGMFESPHQLSIYGIMIFSNGHANSHVVT
ncbi:uncharacterized protein LOC126724297 isoform X11 [Quercus robur]|uniref:uncharacterized protein LOC126724297 isoform X11 n=1 Tax=Quercus robur TaxID=38942 RepID=UPI002162D0C4|nr:uncharacterized protein LOC126724297 isoform X11 [Quercus robur]